MIISTRKITLILLLAVFAQFAKAQVKVGDNPTLINKGAILELQSTDKGLLFPRVALTNTTTWSLVTGSTPVAGMVVYNTKKTADGFVGNGTYPASSPDGTGLYYWDGTGWVAAKGLVNETLTTLTKGTGANAGKFTYKNEAGTLVDIKVTQTGTVAPTGLGTAGDVYVNSATGDVYVYNGATNTWQKAGETLTTLTQGTGADVGKFTYKNEAGALVDIKVTQTGTGAPTGTATAGDVYVNTTTGDVYTYNTTTNSWEKANEALTTLTQGTGANAGKFTYKNEAGTLVDIKVTQTGTVAPTGLGTAGDVYVNSATGDVYVYNGATNTWQKAGETLTTLTQGTGADAGKFTYKNEAGALVDINVTQTGTGAPTGTATAGDVYVNTTTGDVYTYNTTTNSWEKANEALTTLTQGTGANAGKFTYKNEAGALVDIKVTQTGTVAPTGLGTAGDVYVNSATGDVYVYNGATNTWQKAGETLTTLTQGTGANAGKFTYKNEAGALVDIKITQTGTGVPTGTATAGDVYVNTTTGDVYTYNSTTNTWEKANEALTTLTQGTGANAGKFTYKNEAGALVDIKVTQTGTVAPTGLGTAGDVYVNSATGEVYVYNGATNTWQKAGETLTTLTQGIGADAGKFTYKNEAGALVDIKVTQTGTGAPTGTATAGDVYVNTTTGDVYTYNSTTNTWEKANEALTTLTQGTGANAGKFTYKNEAGTLVDIKVTQTGTVAPTGAGTAGDVYVNSATGEVYVHNGTTWQKAGETLTTLTKGTGADAGKFTYKNEAGALVDIKVTQTGTGAPTGTATAGDVYVNTTTGDVYTYNSTTNTWEKANEALTTLTQGTGANAGKFTYKNEAGALVDIKVTQTGTVAPTGLGTAGDVYVNSATGDVYVYNGATNTWQKAGETLTTLTQGTGADVGKFTYKNEAGALVDIKVTQTGTGAPTGPGTAGDVYVNTTNGDVYTYNGTAWVKPAANPWNLESTATTATLNNQNIYQNGNVGIGDFSAAGIKPIANLDIRGKGTVRIGLPHTDELANPSLIGEYSLATGVWNKVSGAVSTSFGQQNTVSGDISTAWGDLNTSSGYLSTTFGASNVNSGNSGTMFGTFNQGSVEGQLVFGRYNAITDGSSGSWLPSDAILQIGNGTAPATRSNTLTVLKSGKTAIGVPGAAAAAKPTELLDLGGSATAGNGGLKIRNINSAAYTGDIATDKYVVADVNGVLKTVTPTAILADVRRIGTNHISEDAGVGGNGTAIPGTDNIAIGAGAMNAATGGAALLGNVAIGGGNQLAKVAGQGNVAVGYGNLPVATGGGNMAIGALNLTSVTTGEGNAAIGVNALKNVTTGAQNIAFGTNTLNLATGSKNLGFGVDVLAKLTTGTDNVGFGVASGNELTTGNYNTFFGTEAGNRILGAAADRYTSGDYSLFLGSQTKAQNAVSNQLNIGNWIYGVNGAIALGNFNGATALPTIDPTNRLDVTAGNVRVRDLFGFAGSTATDKVVVADGNGVLKTVTVASLANAAVTADNGLTKTSDNIQLGGLLTKTTTITANGNPLLFDSPERRIRFDSNGRIGSEAKGTNDGDIYVASGSGASYNRFDIQTFPTSGEVNLTATGAASQLAIATHMTALPAPLVFSTSAGSNVSATERMRITGTGEVAIGTTTAPSFLVGATTIQPKLHVEGDISTTGKIWTTNSVYADYVFEDYFNGFSKIYKDYKFKSLKEVAAFIKANKHLPGVTPISEVNVGKNGYTIDLTQLSMQQLEKLEELYLHVIEMNDALGQKDNEIKALQNKTDELEERLKKLESLLIKK